MFLADLCYFSLGSSNPNFLPWPTADTQPTPKTQDVELYTPGTFVLFQFLKQLPLNQIKLTHFMYCSNFSVSAAEMNKPFIFKLTLVILLNSHKHMHRDFRVALLMTFYYISIRTTFQYMQNWNCPLNKYARFSRS